MQPPLVSNDRWVVLEADIRTTLDVYGIEAQLWLVHDLLVAFQLCLTASGLVKWDTAKKYYQTYPEHLDTEGDEQPVPVEDLRQP